MFYICHYDNRYKYLTASVLNMPCNICYSQCKILDITFDKTAYTFDKTMLHICIQASLSGATCGRKVWQIKA